jgi:hypothetical protein
MNNGVSPDEANKLKEQDFNGQMLSRFEKGDYQELGLKMATILLLLKLRDELAVTGKLKLRASSDYFRVILLFFQ